MKRHLFWITLFLLAFALPAAAEYYTANEDIYYHRSADCSPDSHFSISEEAGWEFNKIACPLCMDRQAIAGEIVELSLPGDFNLYSANMDAEGNLLLAGYTGKPMQSRPYIAMISARNETLWQWKGKSAGIFYRDADMLSDGSIVALSPRSSDAGDDLWKIQIAKDGSIRRQLPYLSNVYRLEPTEDGFLVGSHSDTENYLLQEFDNSGNLLWLTREAGHMYLTLRSGSDLHLGYGRRAVDVADYQGDQHAFALIFDDDGCILSRIEDADAWEFTCGTWCADGSVLLASNRGTIAKYSADGEEIWRRDLSYIHGENNEIQINSKAVRVLAVQDMLSVGNACLLAVSTNDDFARILAVDGDSRICGDWIEATGDFAWVDSLQLFEKDGHIYMLTGGETIDQMQAYASGMTLADIPLKYTFKKLACSG